MIILPVLVLLPQPVTVNLTTYCTALMAWRPLIRWTLLCLFSSPLIHNANTSIKPDKSALQQLYNKLFCVLLEQLNTQFHKDSPAQRGHCKKCMQPSTQRASQAFKHSMKLSSHMWKSTWKCTHMYTLPEFTLQATHPHRCNTAWYNTNTVFCTVRKGYFVRIWVCVCVCVCFKARMKQKCLSLKSHKYTKGVTGGQLLLNK